jgi:hypothetical protein
MPVRVKITRGLGFHPQTQSQEVDIPDGVKTTIADLRDILIQKEFMKQEDVFILPDSNSDPEPNLVSPSGSDADTLVKRAVLVKVDENRNDWTFLQKADEVSDYGHR